MNVRKGDTALIIAGATKGKTCLVGEHIPQDSHITFKGMGLWVAAPCWYVEHTRGENLITETALGPLVNDSPVAIIPDAQLRRLCPALDQDLTQLSTTKPKESHHA